MPMATRSLGRFLLPVVVGLSPIAASAASDVTILRDQWGIPQVYADDVYGLFAGFGYAVAEDRLFQMEMARRSVLGTVSEVLGGEHVAYDTKTRADFDQAALAALLQQAGRAQLKGVLKDQRVIAGIGNAYSDEILHAAKMSPFKPASSLSEVELAILYEAIQTELRGAIQRSEGLAAKDLKGEKKSGMRVHGRKGATCPVCGDTIEEVSFADSSLQYCPTCQTGGKKLADRRLSRLLK